MSATEFVKALSEPAIKLIDTVSHAIGKAYEPRYRRKMADAKAYEIGVISEQLRNNSDLPIVYNGDQSTIDISDYDGLRRRAGARLAFQEIQKQANIESIVDKACDEIEGKNLESEDPVNPDWMNRFITNAGEVSNEEMQTIWAKMLAGEVLQPKSFSLKTLDCVRNLTSEDAGLFSRVAQYVLHDGFLNNDDELNEKYGISYEDILRLDECGLLNSSGTISLNKPVGTEPSTLLYFGNYVLLCKCAEGETKITIGEFPLTQAGKELLSVARTSNYDESYVRDVSNMIKGKFDKCEVTLHKVNSRNGNEINYDLNDILIEPSYQGSGER